MIRSDLIYEVSSYSEKWDLSISAKENWIAIKKNNIDDFISQEQ